MRSLGWELDSVQGYEKIKASKLMVFHKEDAVMPYQKSSLYQVFKERIKMQNPAAVNKEEFKGSLKDRLENKNKPLRVKLKRKHYEITPEAHRLCPTYRCRLSSGPRIYKKVL